MSKKCFKYYVVFSVETGCGSADIETKNKIKTFEDIKSVRDFISKNYCNNRKVIILNYIRIK